MRRQTATSSATYIDELDLPDLLDQLHGGVAVDEEGLGVVAELQRLQPLGHRRGVVAVVADGPHLRAGQGDTALDFTRLFTSKKTFLLLLWFL